MPRQRERDRTAHYSFRINYLRSYSICGDRPFSWSGRQLAVL
jgi:hypothetical protein